MMAHPRALLLLGAGLILSTAHATVWYVDAGALPGGNGISWPMAFQAVGQGIEAASMGDEVWVRGATYAEGIALKDGVTVRGGFLGGELTPEERTEGATETVLTLRALCHGFVSGATVDRLVWRGEAGGIDLRSATLAIHDSLIEGASGISGGAIHALSSTVHLVATTLRRNTVTARWITLDPAAAEGGYGAGAYAEESQLLIRDSALVDGFADANETWGGRGGGVYARHCDIEVIDSTFAGNRCTDVRFESSPRPGSPPIIEYSYSHGGGIYAWDGGQFTMSGSHLVENEADTGGALEVIAFPALIDDCVFSGNKGTRRVGTYDANIAVACLYSGYTFYLSRSVFASNEGLSVFSTNGEVRNCLFINNDDYEAVTGEWIRIESTTVAGNPGGGVYTRDRIENCVIWNNGPFEVEGEPEIAYSLVKGGAPGVGVIDGDPLFVDPENGNYRLLPGSPCIDSGTDLPELTTDLDGGPRPRGAGWDMGAYEFDPEVWDLDEDGLFDTLEGQPPAPGQTNRLLPDSDGDGLPDGTEDANRNGQRDPSETDARALDSDGDGLWDGIEVLLLATDPLDAGDPASYTDGDGDGLPAVLSPARLRRVNLQRSATPSAPGGAGGGFFLDANDANPDTDDDRFTDGYEAVAIGPEAVTSPTQVPALGDVNGDGAVSNADALAVQALFITKIGPDAGVFQGTGFRHADPSRDGYISNKDALVLQSFFLGALPRLPR